MTERKYDFKNYKCGCSKNNMDTVPYWFLCEEHEKSLKELIKNHKG
jgi:hypothetical protein